MLLKSFVPSCFLIALLSFTETQVFAEDLSDENELLQAALQPVGVLSIGREVMELGEVTQGTPVTVKFPYTVTGKGPIKILGIHEDCGCLSTSVKPGDFLHQGATGEFVVVLDTKAFSGAIDKTIMLMTDQDRSQRIARLRIRAKVRQMVSLSPPLVRFDFTNGSKDAVKEAVVAVRRLAGQTLNIEKVDFNKDNLEVDVEPVRDSWQVRIRWKGDAPVQPFQEMIRISAGPPYGDLQIPVLGHVGTKR
ncbi:MAG: DUF1573 domain-containing protein [Bdellovibrionota bacterium]